MLHAPLTSTTAKLDISLLLKSSSPSPPPADPAPASSRHPLSRPASIPPASSALNPLPTTSSQRTSLSSGISAAASQPADYAAFESGGGEGSSQLPHSYVQNPPYPQPQSQRPYLPPLATPSSYNAHTSLSRNPPQSHSHHPPTKRPPPTPSHPSASPAKKQSKWTPEEDALIIDLRGSGMKWEDISKRLPGRSAISCRLHYQNYLERRSEWDEERKNRLARLYERLKPEMWGTLAAELGIPWRAAEAMHWQLGEADMARRAGVVPFSLASASGSSALPYGPGGMHQSGITPGGLHPGPSGILEYGAEGSHSRGTSVHTSERIGLPRSGYAGSGEGLGRLGRRSGESSMRKVQSPGTSSGGGGGGGGGNESAGGSGIVLPSLAEMERGMTTLAGGQRQMGEPPTGPGPGPGPGQGSGGGRAGFGDEERR